MPVLKLFYKLVLKKRRALLIYFSIFMVLMIGFVTNGSSQESQFSKESAAFTIIDRDHGKMGEAVKKQLSKNNEYVKSKDDTQELQNQLFYRKVQIILIIPKNFSKDFENGKDVSIQTIEVENSMASTMVKQELNSYLKTIKVYQAQGYDLTEAASKAAKNQKIETSVRILQDGNKSETRFFYYFRYLPYVLISIILSGMSPVICALQKKEVKKRNTYSSHSLKKTNIELVLGSLFFGIASLAVIDIVGYVLYGKEATAEMVGYAFTNSFLQMLVAMSIAFLVSILLKTENSISAAVNVIGLGSSFLGGIFVPLDFLSKNLQLFAHFVPAYWYTKANEAYFATEHMTANQLHTVYQGFAMQLVFAAAILILGLVITKKNYIQGN